VLILLEQILTPVMIMNFLKRTSHDFTKQSIISSERRVFEIIQFKVKLNIYLNTSTQGYRKEKDVTRFQ